MLVGNPVCYRDGRTAGMAEAVFGRIAKEKVYGITGIQTMAINTLFHLAALSLKGGDGAQWRGAKRILFLPDLFAYWLSGADGDGVHDCVNVADT